MSRKTASSSEASTPQTDDSGLDALRAQLSSLGGGGTARLKICLFCKDRRAATGSAYLRAFDYVPEEEEVLELYGGGRYQVRVRNVDTGQWEHTSAVFELAGRMKPLESDRVEEKTPADPGHTQMSGDADPTVAVLRYQVEQQGRTLERLLERLDRPTEPAVDPLRLVEVLGSLQGKSSTSEAIDLMHQMEEMIDRRMGKKPPGEGGDEDTGPIDRLIDLAGQAIMNRPDRPEAVRSNPDDQVAEEVFVGGVPEAELELALAGLEYMFRSGVPPAEAAAQAAAKIPRAYLVALWDAGFEDVLDLLQYRKPTFRSEEAVDWLSELWSILYGEDLEEEEESLPAPTPAASSPRGSAAPGSGPHVPDSRPTTRSSSSARATGEAAASAQGDVEEAPGEAKKSAGKADPEAEGGSKASPGEKRRARIASKA